MLEFALLYLTVGVFIALAVFINTFSYEISRGPKYVVEAFLGSGVARHNLKNVVVLGLLFPFVAIYFMMKYILGDW